MTGGGQMQAKHFDKRGLTDAGRALQELDYEFDIAFTSVLKRAIRTLWIMLDELDRMWDGLETHQELKSL